MRIALDANLLVRWLARDSERQALRAAAVLIPTMLLCETGWVLPRACKLGQAEIAAMLRQLITAAGIETDRLAAEAGLASLERGGDFAEGVILLEADRAHADQLATFNRGFAASRASPKLLPVQDRTSRPRSRARTPIARPARISC